MKMIIELQMDGHCHVSMERSPFEQVVTSSHGVEVGAMIISSVIDMLLDSYKVDMHVRPEYMNDMLELSKAFALAQLLESLKGEIEEKDADDSEDEDFDEDDEDEYDG